MIPASVLASLGISIAEFVEWAPEASALRAAYDIAAGSKGGVGTYFRFINKYVATNVGSTRKQATAAYHVAKAWANQGEAISTYHRADPIDPRLARGIPADPEHGHTAGNFRTWVEIVVTDPGTQKSRTYSVYVDTFGATTLDDVYGLADYRLTDILNSSPLVPGKHNIGDYELDYKVADFARYV